MLCNDTADQKQFRLGTPLAAVVDRLAAGASTPDLEQLACALVECLPVLDHVQHLAVAVNPERAVQLDRDWARRDNCLTVSRDERPRWVALPAGWSALAKAVGGATDGIVTGQGQVPGGAPWNILAGGNGGTWVLLPVCALGQATIILVAETKPNLDPDQTQAAVDLLTSVAQTVEIVIGLWAANAIVSADLAQARDEKKSLLRLNRLQGRFVAMASHEFKTPLTSITAYTDVLRTQLTDDQFPHAQEFLDVIKTEADRLLRMVNRIVEFTRMEYGALLVTRQPTDLLPLVDETVRGMQPVIDKKDLQVSILAEAGLPRAEVDADLIRQVLVNLVGNAVKFTPPGGAITITVDELESVISVNVADDGPGIPEDDIRKVFREFYRADGSTAKEEGSGLGLTIARHIVNLHGGHIEAKRRATGGSEFRFLVPKETGTVPDLPPRLGPTANSAEAHDLVGELLRLMAELTGSRAVALLLRNGDGILVPAGDMGWDAKGCTVRPVIENEHWTRFLQAGHAVAGPGPGASELGWCTSERDIGPFMCAPLGAGEATMGVVITGRRCENGPYGEADLAQLTILAAVAKAALNSMNTSVGRTAEAVRLLLRIRRTGVPTSTSEALDLLARLARRLGVGESGTRRLQYAAALHDAGMGRVEEEIVLGDTKLNVDQRDEVDRHVEQGVDLMAPLLPDVATTDIIRYHHEKFDGTGHPEGLAGEAIPLGSRLLAVIDAWFSLTRPRTFRAGLEPVAAMAEIVSHSGTQFDPRVVQEFQAVLVEQRILGEASPGTNPTGT